MEYTFTEDTLNYMYRYLLKYVGTYRVRAVYDVEKEDFPRNNTGGIDPTFEDLYINCSRGIIKHTYKGNDILVLCFYEKVGTTNNVYKEIREKYPKLDIEKEFCGSDVFIYFHAKDIKKIATIVKPKTSGAKIDPFSNKNLPKVDYKIPAKDMAELYSLTEKLSKTETMQFYKKVNSDFIKGIRKLDGKKFDAKEEHKKSRLGSREFIHSVGLWDRYLTYVKKQLKNR